MVEQTSFFDARVNFDAQWMQLEIPLNVSSTTNPATRKLHREFEDHRSQDERYTTKIDWPFLSFWVSYVAGIAFNTLWALK
jgi:hypothetical protein